MLSYKERAVCLFLEKGGLQMYLFGMSLLVIFLGAAGTEFLHTRRPELIEKIEGSVKGVMNSLGGRRSSGEEIVEAETETVEAEAD